VRFHLQTGEAKGIVAVMGPNGVAYGSGGSESYEDLCGSPCEVTLPAGVHTLALSKGNYSPPLDGSPVAIPAGNSRVEGTLVSHSTQRWVGFTLMMVGVLAGGALSGYGLFGHTEQSCDIYGICDTRPEVNWPETVIGLAVSTGSLVGGIVLMVRSDEARFRVLPSAPGPLVRATPGRSAEMHPGSAGSVPGLSLSLAW